MPTSSAAVEQVDVVIVGARLAGSAAAIRLAQAGKRVVALDAASFPSDTVSTHVVFPAGMAEMKRLGALDRVLAAGAPLCPRVMLSWDGVEVHGTYSPVDGIDFGTNTRRPQLDMALIDTARAAGAEIRERCKVTGVLWRGNRVAGVHYVDPDGTPRTLEAKLTVGADGRDSRFAGWVGSERYKSLPNGRGLAFHYMTDTEEGAKHFPRRDAVCAWRHGPINSFVFPNNDNTITALLMPPVDVTERCLKDPEEWDRIVAASPEMRLRIGDAVKEQKRCRGAVDTEGYFRKSSGPGWALVGDAGSFKDPVIAQGVRDALWSGRVLGETVAHVLDSPAALDKATRRYEQARDLEVIGTFYWGYKGSRTEDAAVEREFFLEAQYNPQLGRDLADTFSRSLGPLKFVSRKREVTWTLRALRRPGANRPEILAWVVREKTLDLRYWIDKWTIKAGRRPASTASKRWARDGWTPHMALSQHRPSSEPFLPEVEAAAPAPVRRRTPRAAAATTETAVSA
ncbi:MAG: NAD(P)/FAD-dependent oxidoreductase [Sporichthyaceae bacterium]